MNDIIFEYLDYLKKIKQYSINTINSYYEDIKEFYMVINKDIFSINEDDVNKYLEYLYNENISKNSISRKLSGVRGLYNYLYSNKLIDNNLFSDVKNPRKVRGLPNFLTDKEITKLLDVSFDNLLFERNSLIIEILYSTGIRVSELVNIKICDINKYDKTIIILGKGNKERVVYYGKLLQEKLEKYTNNTRKLLNKNNSDYLLLSKNGNKITTRQIENIINKFTFLSGLDKHVTPHTIRHSFATTMLNNGSDIVSVKELLGHSSINTTSIYTHVTNEQIKKVYNDCHPRS